MTKALTQLTLLQRGNCEPLKASIHATALGLFAVMGLYNAAAWLSRRDRHLAVNACVYTVLTAWEQHHVACHVAEMRRCSAARSVDTGPAFATASADLAA